MAAFRPPLMPTVATATPGGICTIESSASLPSRVELIGMPITGTVVMAAITPGRAAAMPAAAIMTSSPRSAAPRANVSTSAGVRWAESAFISKGTSMESRNSAALRRMGRSDVLPMIMLTFGVIICELW
ncbi:hypothetical protein IMSAGC006_02295 [Muribaculaceae bacterium]|nr:hypothetical protein IMSAGC006_02295 [Muribaculaceae bacterium]